MPGLPTRREVPRPSGEGTPKDQQMTDPIATADFEEKNPTS
jgi:hypothetical protein